MAWLDVFTPKEYVESIHHIDLDKLWNMGKRFILSDLDNTLVGWNDENVPNELVKWFQKAQDLGFTICILSNNSGPRVQAFSDATGLPAVSNARKPKPVAFYEAMKKFNMSPTNTVMIGDQLMTDVRGGNRAGVHTILVLPLHPKEWWGTKIVRVVERIVMRRLIRSGLKVPVRTTRV